MSNNAIEVINYLGQQNSPSNLSDIRQSCDIAPTTLTRLLNGLQDDGYIEKVRHGCYRLCHGRLNAIQGQSRRSQVVLAISPGTHQAAIDAIQRTLAENDFFISLRYIQEYSIKHISDIFRMGRQRPDYMVTFFEKNIPQKVLTWLQQENIQLINSGYYGHLSVPTISTDFSAGSERLCQHLIDHGHNKILYIGRKELAEHNVNFRARLEGYQRMMLRHNLHAHSWLQEAGEMNQAHIFSDVRRHIQGQQISAIICENPELLAQLLPHINDLQMRIPQDISVCAFNCNNDLRRDLPCELCYVEEPWQEFGNAVAMHIQSQEKFRDQHKHQAPLTLALVAMPFHTGTSVTQNKKC